MSTPFPSEPLHADIIWTEEDNERNGQTYGIWFEDIRSGFARLHVRVAVAGPDDFIALIEVEGMIFEVRCRVDMSLRILAADVATTDAKQTFHKTLSQRG
ncbi:MAG: hypothetical protein ACK46Q_08015 [Hyphomonas sp.]